MFAGIPSMSSWLHANTSRLSFRKLIISSFVWGFRLVPTWVVFMGSPSANSIVSSFLMISGVLSSIIHVWFSFDRQFQWRQGVLPCQYLVSFYFSNPLFCWKLHLQTVCRRGSFPAIESRLSYNDIVGQRWVYYQKVMLVGYLEGIWASRDRQRYYSLGVHLVSTETDDGRFERTKSLRVYF